MKIFLARIGAMCLLYLFYTTQSWHFVAAIVSRILAYIFEQMGYDVVEEHQTGAMPALHIGPTVFFITSHCTYLDVFFLSAPYIWLVGFGIRKNMFRLLSLFFGLMVINILRIFGAIYMFQHGVSWYRSHEMPDFAIHSAIISVAILATMKRDFRQ